MNFQVNNMYWVGDRRMEFNLPLKGRLVIPSGTVVMKTRLEICTMNYSDMVPVPETLTTYGYGSYITSSPERPTVTTNDYPEYFSFTRTSNQLVDGVRIIEEEMSVAITYFDFQAYEFRFRYLIEPPSYLISPTNGVRLGQHYRINIKSLTVNYMGHTDDTI